MKTNKEQRHEILCKINTDSKSFNFMHDLISDIEELEAKLNNKTKNDNEVLSIKEIKDLMRDPRYWKDEDPDFVMRVKRAYDLQQINMGEKK